MILNTVSIGKSEHIFCQLAVITGCLPYHLHCLFRRNLGPLLDPWCPFQVDEHMTVEQFRVSVRVAGIDTDLCK